MEIYEMTLKQYQNMKLAEFKKSKYWKNVLNLKKEMKDSLINHKMWKWENEWYAAVTEYGRENKLSNKVIYSFDKRFGREHLLHCFRGDRKGLNGWINSDAIGF